MKKQIVLTVKVAKWWPIYVKSLQLFCLTFGTTPCPQAVAVMARKAMTVNAPQAQNKKGLRAILDPIILIIKAWGGGSNR